MEEEGLGVITIIIRGTDGYVGSPLYKSDGIFVYPPESINGSATQSSICSDKDTAVPSDTSVTNITIEEPLDLESKDRSLFIEFRDWWENANSDDIADLFRNINDDIDEETRAIIKHDYFPIFFSEQIPEEFDNTLKYKGDYVCSINPGCSYDSKADFSVVKNDEGWTVTQD
jgi:hypothetical protein